MKHAVRLVLAAAVAAAVAPLSTGSASAAVDAGYCYSMMNYAENVHFEQLKDPVTGVDEGRVQVVRLTDGGLCLVVVPSSADLDSSQDVGRLRVEYALDGVPTVETATFRRNKNTVISTVVPAGTSLSDLRATVTLPRATVANEPYSEQVACTTTAVRSVERTVTRTVPEVERTTRTVIRRPAQAERYAARTALDTKNAQARARYIGAAKRAEARGRDARATRLRARYARARAANVATYRAAVAPRPVQVTEQTIVNRQRAVVETVSEVYEKAGTCTVSGTRAVVRTFDDVYRSTPFTPAP